MCATFFAKHSLVFVILRLQCQFPMLVPNTHVRAPRISSIPLIVWCKLFLETVLRLLTGELDFHVFWDRILQKQLCVTCPSRLFQIHPNSWKKPLMPLRFDLDLFLGLRQVKHFQTKHILMRHSWSWTLRSPDIPLVHGDLRSFELPISRTTRTNHFIFQVSQCNFSATQQRTNFFFHNSDIHLNVSGWSSGCLDTCFFEFSTNFPGQATIELSPSVWMIASGKTSPKKHLVVNLMGNSSLNFLQRTQSAWILLLLFVPNQEYGRDAHWNNFFFFSSSSLLSKNEVTRNYWHFFIVVFNLTSVMVNFLKLPCYNNSAKIWVSDDQITWTWTSCVESFLGCCLALGPPNSSSSSACPRHPCHSILATFLILLWCKNSSYRFHQKICLCAVQIKQQYRWINVTSSKSYTI